LNTTSSAVPVIITIDGPSGSGKGTLSQMLAKSLGYHLLDSGALYRLVALDAMQRALNLADAEQMAQLAANLDVYFKLEEMHTLIMLSGQDVSGAIRQEAVGMNASIVAAYPQVRAALLERQRTFAELPGLIADGRDMGTMVFPAAPVKVFLTASAEARAGRRYKQLVNKGELVDMNALVEDIQERDMRDTQRSVSPLKPADDALLIDSTELSIEQVFAKIMEHIKTKT
jgi:CMP/dCMP kinase